MSLQKTVRFVLGVLLLGCPAYVGCGDGGDGGGSGGSGGTDWEVGLPKDGGSSRVIALDGAEYLLQTSAAVMHVNRASGLQPLGDIDNDGYPDLVVALNRKGSSAPSEHTWIEAYSGDDGKLLWSLQGKHDRDPKISYRYGPIAVVEDLDGDGIRDVYCREDWSKRTAFLISGREGKILGRYPIQRKGWFALPIRCQDCDSDGIPDLLFSKGGKPLTISVLSGKGLAELDELGDLWPEAGKGDIHWVLPTYHDDNSDGVADCLVRRSWQTTCEYAVLDGKSFAVLRTFESPRPRVGAKTFFASVDDVNGDQIGDFVFSSGAGGGPEGRKTLLRAVSGADGAVVWDVAGDQIGGGAKISSINSRTGEKKSLGQDIGFGNAVTTAPDLNGDGVADVAVSTDSGAPDGAKPAVLIVSGKTGEIISTLTPSAGAASLMRGNQVIRLRPKSKPESLVIAAFARSPNGDATLAIIQGDPQ